MHILKIYITKALVDVPIVNTNSTQKLVRLRLGGPADSLFVSMPVHFSDSSMSFSNSSSFPLSDTWSSALFILASNGDPLGNA